MWYDMISAGIYRCNALQRQRLYIYRSMYFNIYIQFRTLTTNLFVYLAQDYMAIAIIYLLQTKRARYLNNVISLYTIRSCAGSRHKSSLMTRAARSRDPISCRHAAAAAPDWSAAAPRLLGSSSIIADIIYNVAPVRNHSIYTKKKTEFHCEPAWKAWVWLPLVTFPYLVTFS